MAIAGAAEGGMRDALSLADQCLSFCGDHVTAADVYAVLGSMDGEFLFSMADALLSSDSAKALTLLDQVIREGRDLRVFIHDLAMHMRALLLAKLCGHCSRHPGLHRGRHEAVYGPGGEGRGGTAAAG